MMLLLFLFAGAAVALASVAQLLRRKGAFWVIPLLIGLALVYLAFVLATGA